MSIRARRAFRRLAFVLACLALPWLVGGVALADEMKKKEKAPPAETAKPAPAEPAPVEKPAPAAECEPAAGVNTLEDLYAYIGALQRLQAASEAAKGESEPAVAAEVTWREVKPADENKKK